MKPIFRIAIAAVAVGAAVAQAVSLLERISERLTANALRADVSFLASDALEGRGTPSRGQDIAAEFIAAQFRRAGLEPAGDDDYFQTAPFVRVTPNAEGLTLSLTAAGKTLTAAKGSVNLQMTGSAALDLDHAGAIKLAMNDAAAVGALTPEQARGKVLVMELPDAPAQAGGRGGAMGGMRALMPAAAKAQAALVVLVRSTAGPANTNAQLREASAAATSVPMLVVTDEGIRTAIAAAKPGPMEATVSAHIAAPETAPVKLHNVIGVLRGSDAALKDTYVVLTGHYDHLGIRGTGEGDHIYNGANDDASGTASVIEIAGALGALPTRPKRSIVFIALFGEELGDVGSHYYARHPVFPIAKTIADVNLEQLGRTDETGEAPKIGLFNLTGFDFTDLPAAFQKYCEPAGVRVVKDAAKSDAYFNRSDNAAFAEVGVPSTTLSVTYMFPDYHRASDEWPKLDYENMAKLDRAIALSVFQIADSTATPEWNAANSKTEAYRKARGN